jgi:pyrimidine-nucleoside phosphorylase
MRATEIIIKKRDGLELSFEELKFFITGYSVGDIPDYQASAWAMAVVLNGMTAQETANLTRVMAESGEILDLSGLVPVVVDKHSTGGVGDKTTLVVEPVVAACGLPVGKMSGRGLGYSGGTLDKLESIPGYRTDLTIEEFMSQLRDAGMVLTGQTGALAPADGKLYSLRDVTGTVQSIPLIASSIMSKKIASGANAIVLDVKVGEGAFMKTLDDARELAKMMVSIAKLADRKAIALLSDMNQPLGVAVGNALELKEAINTLRGAGPEDFLEHCLVVAGYMLLLGGVVDDIEEGKLRAERAIGNGLAWEKFCVLVETQGGDISFIENPEKLPGAETRLNGPAPRDGWIKWINAQDVGETAVRLGAGRTQKGDPIDHSVGIEIFNNVGDRVSAGETLFTIHASNLADGQTALDGLMPAYDFSDTPVSPLPLFYDVIQ